VGSLLRIADTSHPISIGEPMHLEHWELRAVGRDPSTFLGGCAGLSGRVSPRENQFFDAGALRRERVMKVDVVNRSGRNC